MEHRIFCWLSPNGFEETIFEKLWNNAPQLAVLLAAVVVTGYVVQRVVNAFEHNEAQHDMMKSSIVHLDKKIDSLDQKVDRLEEKMDRRFELIEAKFERLEEKIDKRFELVFEILLRKKKKKKKKKS